MATDTFSAETRKKYQAADATWKLWKPWMSEIRLKQATSIDDVKEFLEQAESSPRICWDIETTSLNPSPENICGHSLAFDGKYGIYIPVRHQVKPEMNLDPDAIWDLVMQAIEPPKILEVYNWKFEGQCLRRGGVIRPAKHDILNDIMIYVWLFQSNEKRLNLKESSIRFLKMEMLDIDEVPGCVTGKGKTRILDFSRTDPEDATLYAAADVVMTHRIGEELRPKVMELQPFVVKLEHQLLDSIFSMEQTGVTIDRAFLKQGTRDLMRWAAIVAADLYKSAGYEFNIGSPKEVGEFLKKKGVELSKTKTGKDATGAEVIEKLAEEVPEAAKIMLYRTLIKENSTYVEPLLEATEKEPYARFKFKSVGAPTGRFASGGVDKGEFYADVNVQSIPAADKYQKTQAWLIENPPTQELDSALQDFNTLTSQEDQVGEGLFEETADANDA